jgi:hypothetical protein
MPGSNDEGLKNLARAIARIEELLERLPLDVAKDMRARIATLRSCSSGGAGPASRRS